MSCENCNNRYSSQRGFSVAVITVCRGMHLVIVAGIGLAAGLVEEGNFKEKVPISVGCNTGGEIRFFSSAFPS